MVWRSTIPECCGCERQALGAAAGLLGSTKDLPSWALCGALHVLYPLVEYQDVLLALLLETRSQRPKAEVALVECVRILCGLVCSMSRCCGLQLSLGLENAPRK